ncbi:hypothetical protein NGRA_3223, partial [Nosema granulosis]
MNLIVFMFYFKESILSSNQCRFNEDTNHKIPPHMGFISTYSMKKRIYMEKLQSDLLKKSETYKQKKNKQNITHSDQDNSLCKTKRKVYVIKNLPSTNPNCDKSLSVFKKRSKPQKLQIDPSTNIQQGKKNEVLKGFIYIDSAEFSRKHETKSEQSTVGKFNFD